MDHELQNELEALRSKVTDLRKYLEIDTKEKRLVEIERRLQQKLDAAARLVGATIDAMPTLTMSGFSRPSPTMPGHAACQAGVEARPCCPAHPA